MDTIQTVYPWCQSYKRYVPWHVDTDDLSPSTIFQALSSLRQKLRKYNKDFEADIQAYRENPVESEEEEQGAGSGEYEL